MEPTQHPVADGTATETPGAAVVEIVEQHKDSEKRPLVGGASIIVPNALRINGVRLRATVDQPVMVHPIEIDGRCGRPMAVTVSLFVRALRVGEQPTVVDPDDHQGDDELTSVIEVPDFGEPDEETTIDRSYVYLNGRPVIVLGPITVHMMLTDGRYGESGARVTLTMAARRVVIDDEPQTATISKG